MSNKVGIFACCKNDPIKFAALAAAKYQGVEIEVTGLTSCSDPPHYVDASGKKIMSFFSAVESMTPSSGNSSFLPKNKSELESMKKKTTSYYDYLRNFIGTIVLAGEEHKPTGIKDVDSNDADAMDKYCAHLKKLNDFLKDHTYLVGEKISPADLMAFSSVYFLYLHVLDGETRNTVYPHMTRWFNLISHQPNVKAVLPESFKLCTTSSWESFITHCKSKASSQAKGASAATVGFKFPMRDWKTIYNTEDPKVSIEWFWKNYDPAEFSMYKVVYLYPEELKNQLIAKNLIIGFFQRIEEASKHSFGVLLVLGEPNKPQIMGYMMFPGEEVHDGVKEAPDFDSYSFTKVDTANPDVKKEMNEYLAWSDQVEGLKFLDAKTFQ